MASQTCSHNLVAVPPEITFFLVGMPSEILLGMRQETHGQPSHSRLIEHVLERTLLRTYIERETGGTYTKFNFKLYSR